MLHLFACCDPFVKTRLFSSFCLSLYGAALWKSSDPQLKTLEVTFNNFLRKIWSLPHHSPTGLLYSTAKLQSIYNVVISISAKLLASASGSSSSLISDLFHESARCAYTLLVTTLYMDISFTTHILSNRRNIFTVRKVMCKYVTKKIDRVSKTE